MSAPRHGWDERYVVAIAQCMLIFHELFVHRKTHRLQAPGELPVLGLKPIAKLRDCHHGSGKLLHAFTLPHTVTERGKEQQTYRHGEALWDELRQPRTSFLTLESNSSMLNGFVR